MTAHLEHTGNQLGFNLKRKQMGDRDNTTTCK